MTTLLLILVFLVPIPIALALPAVRDEDRGIWTPTRNRVVAIAGALATLTLVHRMVLGVLDLPAAASTLSPTVYFIWVPWLLLWRSLMPAGATGAGPVRSASLQPRPGAGAVRAAWLLAGIAAVLVAGWIALLAWQHANPAAFLLVAMVPVWGALLYRRSARAARSEPETYPGDRIDENLRGAYARRRALGGLATLALFGISTMFHTLAALGVLRSTYPAARPTLGLLAAVPVAIGIVYWFARRRLDTRIQRLLVRQPDGELG